MCIRDSATPGRTAQILVDVGHALYGIPFLEAIWDSKARRQWEPSFRGVKAVEADLVEPQHEKKRVKIGRSALISALAQALRTRLIEVRRSETGLAKEWDAYNRNVGAGVKEPPPVIAALALAAWGASMYHRQMLAGMPRRDA